MIYQTRGFHETKNNHHSFSGLAFNCIYTLVHDKRTDDRTHLKTNVNFL